MALVSRKGGSPSGSRESSQENIVLSIRIVNLDYYMSPPLQDMDAGYSSFQGRSVKEVPVIRIFGSTTAGQKTCLHLHKVFPYLYVPYDEDLPQEVNEAFVYVRRFSVAIEQAMKMASNADAKKQHVHSCSLVRGKKFYGFHPNEQLFIKIVLYHPKEVSRISTLLLAGGIMNRKFQPHESHIQYLLQFLIDHNLSGMGHIHLAKVKFRQPLPDQRLNKTQLLEQLKESIYPRPEVVQSHDNIIQTKAEEMELRTAPRALPPTGNPSASVSSGNEAHVWLRSNIPEVWMWADVGSRHLLSRHSTCELEVDSSAEDVVNKRNLLYVSLQSSGQDVKMVQSLTSIWEEELERTGNEGAAGALVQPTPRERVLPPISAHEKALRAALSDIVCQYKTRTTSSPDTDTNILSESPVPAEEHLPPVELGSGVAENPKGHAGMKEDMNLQRDTVSRTLVANMNPLSESNVALSGLENERLLPHARGFLSLKATQPANAQVAADTPDENEEVQPPQVQLDEGGLVNEDIVRNQLTQTSEFQGTEKEVIDLLCWMDAAQDDADVAACNLEDGDGYGKLELSQIVCSSDVHVAYTKALSVYEGKLNAECQEILECSREKDGGEQHEIESSDEETKCQLDTEVDEHIPDVNFNRNIECELEPPPEQEPPYSKQQHQTMGKGLGGSSSFGPSIPQMDGQFDDQETVSGENELRCSPDVLARDGQMDEDATSFGGEQLVITPPSKLSAGTSVEKTEKRAASGRLPGPKHPILKSGIKPNSSWCALPLISQESPPTASGQDTYETSHSEKKPKQDHRGVSIAKAVEERKSPLKRKERSSLRDLMRRRRGSKRSKQETSNHPGAMHETEAHLDASKSDQQSDAKDREENARVSNRTFPVGKEGKPDGRGSVEDSGGAESKSRKTPILHHTLSDDELAEGRATSQADGRGVESITSGRTPGFIACQTDLATLPAMVQKDLGEKPVFSSGPVTRLTPLDATEGAVTPRESFCTEQNASRNEASWRDNERLSEAEVAAICGLSELREEGGGKGIGESCIVECESDLKSATSKLAACAGVDLPISETATASGEGTGKASCDVPYTTSIRHCSSGPPVLHSYHGAGSSLIATQDGPGVLEGGGHNQMPEADLEQRKCLQIASSSCLSTSNQACSHVEGLHLKGQPVNHSSPAERLFSLSLIRKPPTKVHCVSTLFSHGLKAKDHGKAFFSDIKDVPAQQTVMAGLVFDLKSNEGEHLPPFVFGVPGRISRSDKEAKQRSYVENELWGLPGKGDLSITVPVHFENDGGISYLLTPARAPPSRASVLQWLQQKQLKESARTNKSAKDFFTIDANTGSLVSFGDADGVDTQDTQSLTQGSFEDNGYFRPASPKYDEQHVLALPLTSGHLDPSNEGLDKARLSRTVQGVVNVHLRSSERRQNPVAESKPISEEKKMLEGEMKLKSNHVSFQVADETLETVKDTSRRTRQWRDVSQITGPSVTTAHVTPLSQCGFRDPASSGGGQQVTLASIEVHEDTRGELRPDPRYDSIGCIVVVFQDDYMPPDESVTTIVLVRDENAWRSNKNLEGLTGCDVVYLPNEMELLNFFVKLVKLYDPDILLGWEIQGFSLGLLAERAASLGISLLKQLSRTYMKDEEALSVQQAVQGNSEKVLFGGVHHEVLGGHDTVIDDEWGRTQGSGIYVGGRTVLNLWRIMRGEVKLGIYSLEAVAEIVLRRRVPRVPWRTLTDWFRSGSGKQRYRCLEYFIDRAKLNLQILDQLDLLSRTAELARIFGIEFFSVFSRGSQYRVESMLLRIAHTQNFLMISPSKHQVAAQPAMECLPLVMEPESRFYTSPVVVLDFQSLYPSMIIAYNLCFSTCLGKIVSQNPKELGVTSLFLPNALLAKLKDKLTLTPNGVMYTPPEVCRGVLPRLLDEILSTRIMVKKAMKKLSSKEKVRQRVLNSRQFALKLIANVTYGYTAAGFSGRMPCAELADSIVQCGRITLERAIHQVNSHPQWGAHVVYGDTDSMFVHLEGRTREEAFRIGQEIASAVTSTNPSPVVLKMEKVYHPCVLLTKKRYVGYSYESPGQAKPTFDAKGIETVRRDSCPVVGKTMERSLRILFETNDLSMVKRYLQRQWGKIISGRISLRDFIFAKEVRLGTYSAKASVLPPAAIVASKAMTVDPRAEPRYAERIPYVVIHGEPGARLVDMVVDPHVLLNNPLTLRLHDTYYITKQIIPSLQRIFGLVGVDLKLWYRDMPRLYQAPSKKPASAAMIPFGQGTGKGGSDKAELQQRAVSRATIDTYYLSKHCAVCGAFTRGSGVVCSTCSQDARLVSVVTRGRGSQLEKELKHLEAICRHCGGDDGSPERKITCISLDCPVFFERRKASQELQSVSATSTCCNQSTQRTEVF